MIRTATDAFDGWWSAAADAGGPTHHAGLAREAFAAAWQARSGELSARCRLDLSLFEARALRNQLRRIADPPAIVGTVLEALAQQITAANGAGS